MNNAARKDFFIYHVLHMTLDNNMFKRLEHCISIDRYVLFISGNSFIMNVEEDNGMWMDNLTEFVFEDKRAVTYKWLSRYAVGI